MQRIDASTLDLKRPIRRKNNTSTPARLIRYAIKCFFGFLTFIQLHLLNLLADILAKNTGGLY